MADPNRDLFEHVVRLLEPVLEHLVFVGGCATGMLISDPAAAGIRSTNEVEAIADITSYAMYSALANRLRSIGLKQDAGDGAAARRWRLDAAIVDIVPSDRSVLGFSNTWYGPAIASAQRMTMAGGQVRLVAPAYFVATQLEAFHRRGHGDVIASSDLEDIVIVVDGRPQLLDEIARADPQVRQFIAAEISSLIDNRRFADSLAGFLPPDRASQARRPLLEKRLSAIAALQRGSTPAP